MTAQHPAILAVRTGIAKDLHHYLFVPLFYLTSHDECKDFAQVPTCDYAIGTNFTRSLFEKALVAFENSLLAASDNTFLSPILQQPLSLGADFVIHSTTKYTNGHSDSVGGGCGSQRGIMGRHTYLVGIKSLIAHLSSMIPRSMFDNAKALAGLAPTLLRLSIGLKDHRDLIASLKQAFDKVRENQ